MVLRALKVSESTCDDNTQLNQWLDNQLADWNNTVIMYVLNSDMLNLPAYYSLFYENNSSGQFFGQPPYFFS